MRRRKRNPPYSRRARYTHKRVRGKGSFDPRSFRTIRVGKHGRLMRVGCPKGYFKGGRCRKGMRAQSILTPRKRAVISKIARLYARKAAN